MIKSGYTLYACWAGQKWFVKQAKSPFQFRRMCLIDERKSGYEVPPRERDNYYPDYAWVEAKKAWRDNDGNLRPKLPPGAPGNRLPA